MKIKMAQSAGFCMGVRRALDIALEASHHKTRPLFTLGPLIHNPQVVTMLEQRGINAVRDVKETPEGSTVIIRAHGISPRTFAKLEKQGSFVLDATCPRVKAVQKIIQRNAAQGAQVIIVGDREHPEVVGLLGHARGRGKVLRTHEEVKGLSVEDGRVCVVAQTTMDENQFQQVVEKIRKKTPHCEVHNTICASTHDRQEEVRSLASEVHAMIVVGGKNSANTQRLAQISKEMGVPTFHVENEDELDLDQLAQFPVVGVTAGASTPNWMIRKVVGHLHGAQRRWKNLTWDWVARILQWIILTNVYVGIGAVALTFTNCLLMGVRPRIPYLMISATYVFSMHLLNRYAENAAREFSDPLRAAFYNRYARILLPLGAVGLMVAILTGLYVGILAFLVTLIVSFLGSMYSVPITSRGFRWFPYRKIKDIPCSKTISVALAWGVVTVLLPALEEGINLLPAPLTVLIFSSAIVFVHSAQLDILDIQGDRIVGKETLPVLLGEAGTRRWMSLLLIFACLLLACATLLGWVPSLGWWVFLSGLYALVYLTVRMHEGLVESILYEAIVHAHFLLMGAIAAVWYVLGARV
jgi:(E)-4-hydroxy-3-methyl-but-2-enyl pyrophosphate reductase